MDVYEALERWRGLAPQAGSGSAGAPRHVLLEGFHALKHALRFGAVVPVALCVDRAGALELAAELAPDLEGVLAGLLAEVDAETLRGLVARPHPTGVAALAERPGPAAVEAALRGRGGRRWSCWTSRVIWATRGPWCGWRPGSGRAGW